MCIYNDLEAEKDISQHPNIVQEALPSDQCDPINCNLEGSVVRTDAVQSLWKILMR